MLMLMQAANPAAGPQLQDIHLPPPPSWWPPAPGWWILATLVLALSIFLFIYLYRKHVRGRRRVALLAEFDRTVATADADAPLLAAALSSFLRRQNLHSAATLSGDNWLKHLDTRIGSDEFSAGVGRALIEAPYRTQASFDAPALIALVRRTVAASFDGEAAHV